MRYITDQRDAILRVLYEAAEPLTSLEIAQRSGVERHGTSVTLDVFRGTGWVSADPDIPRRRGVTRRFILTAHGRVCVGVLFKNRDM